MLASNIPIIFIRQIDLLVKMHCMPRNFHFHPKILVSKFGLAFKIVYLQMRRNKFS